MYSQNTEEAAILEIFANSPPGRLLDCGAADGKTFSNSLALIERGWSGVLIEPSPGAFAALCRTHEGRKNLELVNVAVGMDDRDSVTFYDCPDLVGTTDIAHRDKWTVAAKYNVITVRQLSPMTLLANYPGAFDFVSLDAEGISGDLFFVFLNLMRLIHPKLPKLWMVEHDSREIEMCNAAVPLGYRACYLDGNNLGLVLA